MCVERPEILSKNSDGIFFVINGKIEKLHHQDYDGKRVAIVVKDSFNNSIETKLDIGVQKDLDIIQEEYCFSLDVIDSSAKLLVNSVEQIFVEKLKSLLKFGILSTRYKDVFDFYYLICNTNIRREIFNKDLERLIYADDKLQIKSIDDILNRVSILFSSRKFVNNLKNAKNNWLDTPVEEVLPKIYDFLKSFR